MHGPDCTLAAVPTRHGPQCNYGRYSALVSHLSQSSSPSHSRAQTPFYPRTPACYETHTALHYIHTGRRGCMPTHADRHLPHTQRPHTRCSPHTWSLTHTPCLTPIRHTTHTHGALTRGVSLTPRASLPHGCSHTRAVPCARGSSHPPCFAHACRFRLRCPFNTRRAGKHILRLTRDHTTHTRGRFHTRGFFYTRGLTHTFHHTHRDHTRNHTHRDTHAGDSCHI